MSSILQKSTRLKYKKMVLCIHETCYVTLFWQVCFRQGCLEHLDQRQ